MQFDGFFGKLTTGKWAKIARCSPDTALNDIRDLVEKGKNCISGIFLIFATLNFLRR